MSVNVHEYNFPEIISDNLPISCFFNPREATTSTLSFSWPNGSMRPCWNTNIKWPTTRG